ncbi:male sterility protein-domain-containing protein [Coniella lustricola]|uniref:Male sterility protein-domain-containing protein n=1 Tax=Coniella lustricola TaxID=2025994 RepID=A0A2T3ANJ9_9PEZI|nr:male sterility protein-domain-containing protein [Coniella lustricola]
MSLFSTSDTKTITHEWIRRFTEFPEPHLGSRDASVQGKVVLLTGSTGAVGCHILHALVQRPHVSKVYCLIRQNKKGKSNTTDQRIEEILAENHISEELTPEQRQKITTISYDVQNPCRLGISSEDYETLRKSVNVIVHNAWAVNFVMDISGFEAHCRGTFDLLSLAMQSELKTKPSFVFISTIGAIMNARPFPVQEKLYGFEAALNGTNYTISKWATEQICAAAATSSLSSSPPNGLGTVSIIRLGQICGDTKHGMWNPKEAVPRCLAAGYTIGFIPATASHDETLRWLPSDVTGAAIADIALLDQISTAASAAAMKIPSVAVYHIENSKTCRWHGDVLAALRRHGMTDFKTLPWHEWAERLAQSDSNVLRNPPYRLLRFYQMAAAGREVRAADGADANVRLALDTTQACRVSPRLAEGTVLDDALFGKFLRYWKTQPDWAGQVYAARL